MGFFDRISQGLQRSRDKFKEEMNVLLDRGPDLDEEFWDGLEETLILADIGGAAACDIVENLRDQATRKALPDAYAVLDLLNDQIADTFTQGGQDDPRRRPGVRAVRGHQRHGQDHHGGQARQGGAPTPAARSSWAAPTRSAPLRSSSSRCGRTAPTSRWSRASAAPTRQACATTPSSAPRAEDADLVLIDTAGRLHTSADLMRELAEGRQRGAQALEAARVHRARHRRHHRPERPAAGARVQPRARAGRA